VGLPCFYDRRGFRPAWIGEDGRPLPALADLMSALRGADAEGLEPEDYHLSEIRSRAEALAAPAPGPEALADLDLLATDAFLSYAAHLSTGRVDPEALYRDCRQSTAEGDLPRDLEEALSAGRIGPTLAAQAPLHEGYVRLRAALARYRAAAERGGWPIPSEGPTLRPGAIDPRVAELRARLEAGEGLAPLPPASPEEDRQSFDPALRAAVEAFQARHGLTVDGVVGPATLGVLRLPIEARIRQIQINMERWRWLPRDLAQGGNRYVMIDEAGFRLRAVQAGRPPLILRVIVGKEYTRTPSFSNRISQVILNPSWHVPASIARNEIWPKAKKDPSYLAREGIQVEPDGGLRQVPGPKNALGRIKFLFPNPYNVYLHDTPARSLFSQTRRAFSHGCIRLENPLELADWIFAGDPDWSPERLRAALDTGRERAVKLPRPVPIHLTYLTAWVEDDGTVSFRRDLYGRDEPLLEVLREGAY
jgi:murein L,D-transpeptidase YcbB/YkuD